MTGHVEQKTPGRITGFDLVGLGFAAFGLLWAVAAALVVAPFFGKSLADLGGALPAFTILCLSPWFPLVIALVPLGVASVGVLTNSAHSTRPVLMVVAIMLALAAPCVHLAGLCLPIVSLAGSIK